MNREEISKGVGNIDDSYIREAKEYSQTRNCIYSNIRHIINELTCKPSINIKQLNSKKLWKASTLKLACIMLILCSVLGLCVMHIHTQTTNETLYKPAIMYKNKLYFQSLNHPITYDVDRHNLIYIGVIQDTISSCSLPDKSFQTNFDLGNSTIYLSEKYRSEVFVYDSDGNLWVFEVVESNE